MALTRSCLKEANVLSAGCLVQAKHTVVIRTERILCGGIFLTHMLRYNYYLDHLTVE